MDGKILYQLATGHPLNIGFPALKIKWIVDWGFACEGKNIYIFCDL
jgi:hypothetical protein